MYTIQTHSRLLEITVLFCRIQSLLWGSFAKETYNFKESTNRSQPIGVRSRVAKLLWSDTLDMYTIKTHLNIVFQLKEATRGRAGARTWHRLPLPPACE